MLLLLLVGVEAARPLLVGIDTAAAPRRYRRVRGCRSAPSLLMMVLQVCGLQNYLRLLVRFCSRRGRLVAVGKRCCVAAVRAVRCHLQLCPLVPSQRGYSEGVADVLLTGIVPLSAEILFGALVV
jgi:hypothetical protein